MAKLPKRQKSPKTIPQRSPVNLVWLKASYSFHTYAYRDPRSVFASAVGCPVVSPTTVLLGVVSTLFRLGRDGDAKQFLAQTDRLSVRIESPKGIIFFRAFHQLRRYETDKYDKTNPSLGLTKINQGTREYGLVDGSMNIYLGITESLEESARFALTNLTHLGTHDSLCSLEGEVEETIEPQGILYVTSTEIPKEQRLTLLKKHRSLVAVTLSRFKQGLNVADREYWWLAGGEETEAVAYIIPGKFVGTTRGKIYLR